jgi:L-lactate utilization protein LutB
VDNGVAKGYYLRELDKSRQEKLSPHCPEIQGCIRCGVCVETPNPSYPLPEKWKALGTSPHYLRVAAS